MVLYGTKNSFLKSIGFYSCGVNNRSLKSLWNQTFLPANRISNLSMLLRFHCQMYSLSTLAPLLLQNNGLFKRTRPRSFALKEAILFHACNLKLFFTVPVLWRMIHDFCGTKTRKNQKGRSWLLYGPQVSWKCPKMTSTFQSTDRVNTLCISLLYTQNFSALKKMLALALSAQTKMLSSARAPAQFFGSLVLSLVLNNNRALLNFAVSFKRFFEVFEH